MTGCKSFDLLDLYGGEGGIRTPDRVTPMPDFESGAFNRALPPLRVLTTLFSTTLRLGMFGYFSRCCSSARSGVRSVPETEPDGPPPKPDARLRDVSTASPSESSCVRATLPPCADQPPTSLVYWQTCVGCNATYNQSAVLNAQGPQIAIFCRAGGVIC